MSETGEASREMTLDEWCERLPEIHRVRRELAVLKTENAALRERVAALETAQLVAEGNLCVEQENDALRERVEQVIAEIQAIFLVMTPECPAYPGQPNTCDVSVCDCWAADSLLDRIRAASPSRRERQSSLNPL